MNERTGITLQEARDLMQAARQATKHAYVPYSEFPVGAALLTTDGQCFTGCNVENASYPLSMCAERSAIGVAVSAGFHTFRAVAVSATKVAAVTPCGGCRQVLNEFKPVDVDLIVVLEGEDDVELLPLAELLPRAFGPRDLEE